MPAYADRVKDTTTTTGTGNVTLSGTAPTGFQTFNAAFGTNKKFEYTIELNSEWETGEGYLSASTTLVRATVIASSNAGALVNFSAGTKNVFAGQNDYGVTRRTSWAQTQAVSRCAYWP
jgi:hypothetical protein